MPRLNPDGGKIGENQTVPEPVRKAYAYRKRTKPNMMVKKTRTHFSPFTRTQPVPTRTGILFRASRAIHLDFWGDSRNTFSDEAGFPRVFRGLLFFRPPEILSLNAGMEKSIRLHLLELH